MYNVFDLHDLNQADSFVFMILVFENGLWNKEVVPLEFWWNIKQENEVQIYVPEAKHDGLVLTSLISNMNSQISCCA